MLAEHSSDGYIKAQFDKLKELNEMVFGSVTGDGKIEHIQTKMMPVNLDEERYIKIYRKQ